MVISEVVKLAYKECVLDNVSAETETTPAGQGEPDDARYYKINLWEDDSEESE